MCSTLPASAISQFLHTQTHTVAEPTKLRFVRFPTSGVSGALVPKNRLSP